MQWALRRVLQWLLPVSSPVVWVYSAPTHPVHRYGIFYFKICFICYIYSNENKPNYYFIRGRYHGFVVLFGFIRFF